MTYFHIAAVCALLNLAAAVLTHSWGNLAIAVSVAAALVWEHRRERIDDSPTALARARAAADAAALKRGERKP